MAKDMCPLISNPEIFSPVYTEIPSALNCYEICLKFINLIISGWLCGRPMRCVEDLKDEHSDFVLWIVFNSHGSNYHSNSEIFLQTFYDFPRRR